MHCSTETVIKLLFIQSCFFQKVEPFSITKGQPLKGRRCIPNVFKNEDSMVQTCQNINVHVINTDIKC